MRASEHELTGDEISKRQLEQQQALQRAVETEPRDHAWARDYENSIEHAVQSVANDMSSRTEVQSLTCRTSVCRLAIGSKSIGEQATFLRKFPFALSGAEALHVSRGGSDAGATTALVYVMRKGHAPIRP